MKHKLLGKPVAILISLAMVFTSLGGLTTAAYADTQKPVKFSVEISSKANDGTQGVVRGEVYSDYTGKLTVTGDKVNAGNAQITVTMTDVASLGVSGTRSYTREIKSDASRDVAMTHVTTLFDKLDKTSVNLTYGKGNSVNYKVTNAGNGVYTLEPEGDAAAVWHAIVNDENFEYGTQEKEDSYVVIGKGSWLKAGNSILEFEENYKEDLVLDNFGDMSALNSNIRNAVVLNSIGETEEGVSFNLTPGTKLAMGSSYAQLKGNASFDFGIENYQAIEQSLKDLRDLSGDTTEELMKKLFGVLDTVFTAVGGTTVESAGNIEPVPETKDPDKQPLADLVKQAIDKMSDKTYTAETYKELVESINKAIDVIADKNATQDDIDTAMEDLQKKFDGLKPVDSETPADQDTPSEQEKPAPGSDPDQKGIDGTAVGQGASAAAADKAITSMKNDNDPVGSKFVPLKLKSTKQGKKSIKLKWTKAKGATSYVVYGNNCGKKNKMKKLATVGKNTYNVKKAGKKLKKGKYYKFIVVALDKNKNVVSTSKVVHVATTGGKVGNHKSVRVTKKVVNKAKKLKKGRTLKLNAKALAKSKKLKVKKHIAVRYETSNEKIATVSKKGVVKGKAKGTCYIYAFAQNGVSKKVKVTVK